MDNRCLTHNNPSDPKSTVIVDVRSPIEYNYAHVPTAFNVPLFTGSIIASDSSHQIIQMSNEKKLAFFTNRQANEKRFFEVCNWRGLTLLPCCGRLILSLLRLQTLVRATRHPHQGANNLYAFCPEKELIVYCARGGMRSRCMAFLFSLPDSGLSINVMKGGTILEPPPLL